MVAAKVIGGNQNSDPTQRVKYRNHSFAGCGNTLGYL
jgi:hypothetical protein